MNPIHRPFHTAIRRLLLAALLLAVLPALPAGATEAGKRVNINTADTTQLALLPRIGPSVAQKIVAFRKENGPFKAADDLLLVPGIGEKTFALLKPYLAISGETTLQEKVRSGKSKPKEAKEPKAAPKAEGKPKADPVEP